MSAAKRQAVKKAAPAAGSVKRKSRGQAQANPYLLPVLLVAGAGLVLLLAAIMMMKPGNVSSGMVGPVRVGAPMSSFDLLDITGQRVRLSDFEGQVVLVNAWATWCPPCRAEMPALNAFYQNHAQTGFVILAVNAGDQPALAVDFAREYGLAFPVLLDPQTRLLDSLNIRSFPTSVLVDREGIIRDIHIGMLTPAQIEEKVMPLLSQ